MKIPELKRKLGEHGVHPQRYAIEESTTSHEYFRLEKWGSVWTCCFFERGNQSDLRFFDDEDGACQYLFDRLVHDPSTRR